MRHLFWAAVGSLLVLAASTAPAWAGGAAWGTIKSTATDKNQFVLVENGKEKLFTLTDKAHVRRDGKDTKLADLKSGDDVVVLYLTAKDGLYAVDVCTTREHWAQTAKGQIKSIKGGHQFVLTFDGKDELFTLADKAPVWENTKAGSLSDLKPGTGVSVDYVKVHGGLYATSVKTR